MPQMGVSVSEGTITKWLKQEGEHVEADEPLLEISTDKVDTEVPSPGTGTVTQILVQEGETVEVGTRLAVIGGAPAEAGASEPEAPPEAATAPAAQAAAEPSSAEVTPPPAPAPAPTPTPAPLPASYAEPEGNGKSFVSPIVARIASEHGVDVAGVPGTGRGGRVTKKDILAFVESGAAAQQATPAPPPAPAPSAPAPVAPAPAPAAAPPAPAPAVAAPAPAPAAPPPAPAPAAAPPAPARAAAPPAAAPAPAPQPATAEAGEQFEPMSAMRRGIAEHMRRSLDTSAHVTSAIEVDMSKVVEIRKQLKPEYQQAYSVNLTYLAFVARAVVETLRDYPWINGEIRGEQIVTRNYVNLGFAVELADGKGLIVPVLKHAEGLNLLGVARGVVDIAQRARDKKLLPDEVQGGTFTITNPGGYGTFHGTPVISQPQAAILGTYAVVKRPWVVEDEFGQDVIAIRPIMNLTLTYDHRLVDGALAGRFLRDLRHKLETWDESNY
ncbi:MAG TPA: dihydrolipoamide acetyltransferase family protein [Gaiellaceae bacterium]|nr:dihydrolipoamide acetyltransferase family protein [Gaiellaceae bacterium]